MVFKGQYGALTRHWQTFGDGCPVTSCTPDPLQMSSGIEPGVSVSVKSSNDCVYTTLAFSAVQSALTAYSGGSAATALLYVHCGVQA